MNEAPLPPSLRLGGAAEIETGQEQPVNRDFLPKSQELRRLHRQRLGAAGIIVRLMRECEALRTENQRLRIAVRGFDIQPESPFPLLSGAEVLRALGGGR